MKGKIISLILATAVVAAPLASACDGDNSGNGEGGEAQNVRLVNVDPTQVGVADCDYFVAAEPAATARANAVADLNFAGNLQELYGGGKGYPQAVVVVKNELAHYSFCNDFYAAMERSAQWLNAETTSAETVVQAVTSHLTEGLSPTFNAKNLTKQVIANCGVKPVAAYECKDEIKSFMTEINGVAEQPFGLPTDNFYMPTDINDAKFSGNIKVVAPDGAPALGLAKLLAGEENFDGVNIDYEIVNASLIQTYVGGNSPKADICVLPVNLAVKLLGSGEKYKILCTLTHGNLYLLSKNGENVTADNIKSALSGKRVGVINLAAVPGLTFKIILKKYGIGYVAD